MQNTELIKCQTDRLFQKKETGIFSCLELKQESVEELSGIKEYRQITYSTESTG